MTSEQASHTRKATLLPRRSSQTIAVVLSLTILAISWPGTRSHAHELDNKDAISYEELLAGAKKEGKLMFYSALPVFSIKTLLEEFKKKYPFVETEFVRAGGLKIAQRFYTEKSRKIEAMDMIFSGAAEVYPDWREKKLISRVDNLPEYKSVIDIAKGPKGYYVAFGFCGHVLVWNRKIYKDDQIPDDLWEFTKPEWKDKTASGDPTAAGFALNWFSFAADTRAKDPRSQAADSGLGFAWMEKMAMNGHLLAGQIGNLTDALVSGRRGVAIQQWDTEVTAAIAKGADLGWKYPKQGTIAQHILGGINEGAPHPYTARLFLNWLLSKEGQTIVMKDVAMNTVRKDMKTSDFLPGRKAISESWVLDIEKITPEETKAFLEKTGKALHTK